MTEDGRRAEAEEEIAEEWDSTYERVKEKRDAHEAWSARWQFWEGYRIGMLSTRAIDATIERHHQRTPDEAEHPNPEGEDGD